MNKTLALIAAMLIAAPAFASEEVKTEAKKEEKVVKTEAAKEAAPAAGKVEVKTEKKEETKEAK